MSIMVIEPKKVLREGIAERLRANDAVSLVDTERHSRGIDFDKFDLVICARSVQPAREMPMHSIVISGDPEASVDDYMFASFISKQPPWDFYQRLFECISGLLGEEVTP